MKSQNKGVLWKNTAVHLKEARIEVNNEEADNRVNGNWAPKTQKQRKTLVIGKAQKLAEGL
eukprot:7343923-Prorocentrum_lima.AAC.1